MAIIKEVPLKIEKYKPLARPLMIIKRFKTAKSTKVFKPPTTINLAICQKIGTQRLKKPMMKRPLIVKIGRRRARPICKVTPPGRFRFRLTGSDKTPIKIPMKTPTKRSLLFIKGYRSNRRPNR